MKQRKLTPEDRHRAFRTDALAMLDRHGGHLSATEMLALAAHLVGQIIAMQDQRTATEEIVMQTVIANIEQGNREAMAEILSAGGRAN